MKPKQTARRHKYETDKSLPTGLRSLQAGSWRVVYLDEGHEWMKSSFALITASNITANLQAWLHSIKQASIARYLVDVYYVAPHLILGYLFVNAIASLQSALELHAMTNQFNAVEVAIRSGGDNVLGAVIRAILIRLFVMNLGALCSWFSTFITPVISERITASFKARLIEAHLSLDVISARDKTNSFDNFSPSIASEAFHGFVRLITSLLSTFSQLSVLGHLLWKQEGGITIVFLSLLSPIFSWFTTQVLWEMLAVLYVSDPWALRARAMYTLATETKYHEEIASYGLHSYVSREYRQATQGSPLTYDDDPSMALRPRKTPLTGMIKSSLSRSVTGSSFQISGPTSVGLLGHTTWVFLAGVVSHMVLA